MFYKIFKNTIPVAFGYISLAMTYGILAQNAGMPIWAIILASVIVYAGSGQFLLVSLLSAGAGLLEIFVASFLLNLRHMFYALTLLSEILALKHKFYLIFALTDETFALLKTIKIEPENLDKVYNLTAFLNQIYWLFGTILGIFVANFIKIDYSGIEFCLTALFVVLSVELFKDNRNYKILFLAIFLGIFALSFLPPHFMLIITLISGLVIILGAKKWI